MARTPRIRLTKNDRKEYARLVKNAKAKARNVLKNYGIDLSDVTKVPKIESIKTRKEFKELTQKLSSFTNRANTRYQFVKNDHGVTFNKHEVYLAKKYNKAAQDYAENLRKKIKDKNFIVKGKPVMTVGDRMSMLRRPTTAGISKPPKFNINNFRTHGDVSRYIENMYKRSRPDFFDRRMGQMKQNFMEILSLSFNDDADHIVEMLKAVPNEDFYEMYMMFSEFDFDLYSSEGQPLGSEGDMRQVERYLTDYFKGEIDFDFKSFGNRV